MTKPFGKLTDAEQGALLLAYHRGEDIEYWSNVSLSWDKPVDKPSWHTTDIYRVKPDKPTIDVYLTDKYEVTTSWVVKQAKYKLTVNLEDGTSKLTEIGENNV